MCVLRRKDSNQTNCGLKGCAVKSHWRKIQQCQHACPMETDVNKTADGFKNVFSIKETHRRMCIRLTCSLSTIYFMELQHLDLEQIMG